MTKHVSIKITGKVQGVGFRYHCQNIANELSIKGFVKNEYDGSVYIEASSEIENMEQFVNWCHNGPKWAMVENVQILENPIEHVGSFVVK